VVSSRRLFIHNLSLRSCLASCTLYYPLLFRSLLLTILKIPLPLFISLDPTAPLQRLYASPVPASDKETHTSWDPKGCVAVWTLSPPYSRRRWDAVSASPADNALRSVEGPTDRRHTCASQTLLETLVRPKTIAYLYSPFSLPQNEMKRFFVSPIFPPLR